MIQEEKIGIEILKRAIEAPIRQIAENAGKDGAVVVAEVLKLKDGFGYNAATDACEDLMQSGVVDPTKVARFALENAASAAGMFLTTECVVAELPENKKGSGNMPAMPGHMPEF